MFMVSHPMRGGSPHKKPKSLTTSAAGRLFNFQQTISGFRCLKLLQRSKRWWKMTHTLWATRLAASALTKRSGLPKGEENVGAKRFPKKMTTIYMIQNIISYIVLIWGVEFRIEKNDESTSVFQALHQCFLTPCISLSCWPSLCNCQISTWRKWARLLWCFGLVEFWILECFSLKSFRFFVLGRSRGMNNPNDS